MAKCLLFSHYRTASVIALMLCLASQPVVADSLSPRAELNVRAGSERTILMTEFWAPLAQQNDRVLYGDLRLMGDNDDNKEGNLGFGYRQMAPRFNSVLGAHAWIDRRRTGNGNNFHQVTIGVESLGETIDLRANGYIQLNNAKTSITPNIGSTIPYLSGSGIFYDTNGFIVEEPQDGFDAEIGYRLPIFQKHIDSTRVYAGGYHFFGDTTDSTTGFRLRTEAQINSIFSVGARFQHDASRGSQGFLEATLRFPFSAKKSFQTDGLKSRLDESPERDIDIVTGAKVDTGLLKPVLNASGTEQRILYVDNTNTQSGDGTKENPYKTLKAAEEALKENDILYVNHGDGTTMGMDQGIVINKANVTLIGSGSDLTYTGFTLLSSDKSPIITNLSAPPSDNNINTVGNGILVAADNISISGLTVHGALKHGVYVGTVDGGTLNNITIRELTVSSTMSSNNNYNIYIMALNGGEIKNALIESVAMIGGNGIAFSALTNSKIEKITAKDITASLTSRATLIFSDGGYIGNSDISNITSANSVDGVYLFSTNYGVIESSTVANVVTNGNSQSGFRINTSNFGKVETVNFSNMNLNNSNIGVRISASSNSLINQLSGTNIISNNGNNSGVYISSDGGSTIGSASLSNTTASGNAINGLYVYAIGGSINNVALTNVSADRNTQHGLRIDANGGTIRSFTATGVTLTNNKGHGLYAVSSGTNGLIKDVNLSDMTASNNKSNGVYVLSTGTTSLINNFNITSGTAINNSLNGVYFNTTSSGTINGVSVLSFTTNSNLNNGVAVQTNNGLITNVLLSDIIAYSNVQNGVYLAALGNATLSNVSVTGINANSNIQNGIYITAATNTTVMDNISASFSNFLNNTNNGIYIFKQNASAIFNIDLGGGASMSAGQNRSFANGSKDLQLNYIGGGAVFAKNNWWGVNTGLAAGRVTLSASTTVDATAFLTTDPRP